MFTFVQHRGSFVCMMASFFFLFLLIFLALGLLLGCFFQRKKTNDGGGPVTAEMFAVGGLCQRTKRFARCPFPSEPYVRQGAHPWLMIASYSGPLLFGFILNRRQSLGFVHHNGIFLPTACTVVYEAPALMPSP